MENKKETKGLLGKIRKSGKALALVGALAAGVVGVYGLKDVSLPDPIVIEYDRALSDEIYYSDILRVRMQIFDCCNRQQQSEGSKKLLLRALQTQKEFEEVNPSLRNRKYEMFESLGYDIRPIRN